VLRELDVTFVKYSQLLELLLGQNTDIHYY